MWRRCMPTRIRLSLRPWSQMAYQTSPARRLFTDDSRATVTSEWRGLTCQPASTRSTQKSSLHSAAFWKSSRKPDSAGCVEPVLRPVGSCYSYTWQLSNRQSFNASDLRHSPGERPEQTKYMRLGYQHYLMFMLSHFALLVSVSLLQVSRPLWTYRYFFY